MTAGRARHRIVIPDDINGSFQASPNLARLRADAEVGLYATRASGEKELAERIRDATIVLSFRPAFTRFPRPVLDGAANLKMIAISGTGVEDVDVAEATRRGIAVANVPGPSNRAVAEHCLALLFAVARAVPSQDRAIRRGEWQAAQGIELGGKAIGIVGVSGISSELAPLARALGMTVISWSRNNDPARAQAIGARAVSLDELLAAADVISLHVRLNDGTRGMIGADQFARMKRRAILINTARGGVVDERALAEALRAGRIAGAALDVFEHEPLGAQSPLADCPNLLLTPHIAGVTRESNTRVSALIAARVAEVLDAAG